MDASILLMPGITAGKSGQLHNVMVLYLFCESITLKVTTQQHTKAKEQQQLHND